MICALIMAGGRGTRFWPMSTDEKPKQFLSLINDKTMLQLTVERLLKIMTIDQIFIATGNDYVNLTLEQLPNLPKENIIVEPIGRNTAPCIVLSAMRIEEKYPNASMIVLPSDALISDVEVFINVIQSANDFIEKEAKSVVTIGIQPTRPETGYGYIKTAQIVSKGKHPVIKVERFVEKPDFETAKQYLADGSYLWNAGMFIWKTEFVKAVAERLMSETYYKLLTLGNSSDEGYKKKLEEVYPTLESISVDYAIMEKLDSIYVVPGNFGWDDIGTWSALERYLPKDNDNNTSKSRIVSLDSKNNIVFSSNKKVVLLGVEDLFCIESESEIIIGRKEKISEVHKIKEHPIFINFKEDE